MFRPTRNMLIFGNLMSSQPRVLKLNKVVPFTVDEVYDVVSNVNKYNEFLPYVERSKVTKHNSKDSFDAVLQVGFGVWSEKYTSRVTTVPGKMVQSRALDSSIFKNLTSKWTFTPLDDKSCSVSFQLDYEVANPLLRVAVDAGVNEVSELQVAALMKHCDNTYLPRRQRPAPTTREPSVEVATPEDAREAEPRAAAAAMHEDVVQLFQSAINLARKSGMSKAEIERAYSESKASLKASHA